MARFLTTIAVGTVLLLGYIYFNQDSRLLGQSIGL